MSKPVPLHDLAVLTYRVLARRVDDALAHTGFADLSLSLCSNVLRFLDARGRRLSELPDLAGVSKQAINRQVRYLQQRGYIRITADTEDARAQLASLTKRGQRAHRAVLEIFDSIESGLVAQLGAERLRDLRADLLQITQLDRYGDHFESD